MIPGADDGPFLAEWRRRHANTDALGAWRQAPLAEAGYCAFIAIALDPPVLDRLDAPEADRLAAQARAYVSKCLGADPAGTNLRSAAARVVRAALWARKQFAADHAHLPGTTPAASPDSPACGAKLPAAAARPRDMWQAALRNFPQFDGRTGRAAAELVGRSGGAVLTEARQPWNHLLALGTLRYAARVVRGDITGHALDRAALLGAVLAVQRFARESGLSPMRVPYVSRYGTPAVLAAGLSQDAATLEAMVRAADSGEPADVWAEAEAMHAFAAVAIEPEVLQALDLTESLRLAAAAIRFAEPPNRAAQAQMPLLPRGCKANPADVAALARAALFNQDEAMLT